ncbi:MAG: hypothetical protein QGF98_05385, partial [Candidatus Poseidoniia archaeon]|nr:hypothetical protein [Candidatus Poseidoniia archaeon]
EVAWKPAGLRTQIRGFKSPRARHFYIQYGDLDIIAAFIEADKIAWYETTAIPEFSNIMMPIVSVLAIVGFNYRRRKTL